MREFFESFSSWIFYNDNYHYIILQSTGTYIFTTLKRDVRHETSKTTIDFLQIVYQIGIHCKKMYFRQKLRHRKNAKG